MESVPSNVRGLITKKSIRAGIFYSFLLFPHIVYDQTLQRPVQNTPLHHISLWFGTLPTASLLPLAGDPGDSCSYERGGKLSNKHVKLRRIENTNWIHGYTVAMMQFGQVFFPQFLCPTDTNWQVKIMSMSEEHILRMYTRSDGNMHRIFIYVMFSYVILILLFLAMLF